MTPKFNNLISEMAWKYMPSDRALERAGRIVRYPDWVAQEEPTLIEYFIQQIRKNKKFAMWLAGVYVFNIEDVERNKKSYEEDLKAHISMNGEIGEPADVDRIKEYLKDGIEPIPYPHPEIWIELEDQIPGLQWPPSADMVPHSGMPEVPRWLKRGVNRRIRGM